MSTNKKKLWLSSILAGSALATIAFSPTTSALWRDQFDLDDFNLSSGHMQVRSTSNLTWQNTSNASAQQVLPGESIIGKIPISIAIEGNNVLAKPVLIYNPNEGISGSWRLLTPAGAQLTPPTPFNNGPANNFEQGSFPTTIDDTTDAIIEITLNYSPSLNPTSSPTAFTPSNQFNFELQQQEKK